jgi:release factor glutamine methyltransferase
MAGREHLAAVGVDEAGITAEVLLRHVLDVSRTQLYMVWHRPMDTAAWARYEAALAERARGRPVAYITGHREFMGLDFQIDERVLIPRPETELLVEVALEILGDRRCPVLADIGTGSGALAVSLAVLRPDATIIATDLSGGALAVAQANAARHAVSDRIRFLQGDLLEPLRAQRVSADLIVCNPPYVAPDVAASLPREIRDFEPRLAVVAPGSGEAVHNRMIGAAPAVLRSGGWLAMEVAAGQAARVVELLKRSGGFGDPQVRRDGLGWERVVAARVRSGSSVEDQGDVLQPHV